MSSFRDRVIEIVKDYYEEEIEASTKILQEAVELINLYINHQDKKYEKIFKEGVYCDLVYDEEISPFLPIAVLKSTKSESVKLRIIDLPKLSKALRKTDPENDNYDEAEDAITYVLCNFRIALNKHEIASVEDEIYLRVSENAEVDEDGELVDEEEFDFSLKYAFDYFFHHRSSKKIAEMFSMNIYREICYEDVYSSILNMMEAIETKNLYDEIFSIRSKFDHKNFEYSRFEGHQNPTIISKIIAQVKFGEFNVCLRDSISDDILEYILDTENIFIPISMGVKRDLPKIDTNRERFKGVVKNIHILVKTRSDT